MSNPSRIVAYTIAGLTFEPAAITTKYPPGHSGGLSYVSACEPDDRGLVAKGKADGWLVVDDTETAQGAVIDDGYPGKARWSFAPLRPPERARRGKVNELTDRLVVAPSFLALLEKIA